VATADLFPRVRVTGFIGFLSGSTSTFGNSASQAWSVAPASAGRPWTWAAPMRG
jgi:multidrug efflux system outer membrane protein